MVLECLEKNLPTSLGPGSDSEEDEEDKPMFGEGYDGDYYEQLVMRLIIIKNTIGIVIAFNFHRKSMRMMKKHWKCLCLKNLKPD